MNPRIRLLRAIYSWWWRYHRLLWKDEQRIQFQDDGRGGWPHIANGALLNLINRQTATDPYANGAWANRRFMFNDGEFGLLHAKAYHQFVRLPFDGHPGPHLGGDDA